jgi:hypothetical protein
MHEHELHVSRALSATKLHALKHACRILDALDPATQFAEMRRLIGVILAARADDIEPHFGCSVPPVYGPPKPPHTDPNYNADHLEDLPPAPAGIVYAPGAHRPKPRAQEHRPQASDKSPPSTSISSSHAPQSHAGAAATCAHAVATRAIEVGSSDVDASLVLPPKSEANFDGTGPVGPLVKTTLKPSAQTCVQSATHRERHTPDETIETVRHSPPTTRHACQRCREPPRGSLHLVGFVRGLGVISTNPCDAGASRDIT